MSLPSGVVEARQRVYRAFRDGIGAAILAEGLVLLFNWSTTYTLSEAVPFTQSAIPTVPLHVQALALCTFASLLVAFGMVYKCLIVLFVVLVLEGRSLYLFKPTPAERIAHLKSLDLDETDDESPTEEAQ